MPNSHKTEGVESKVTDQQEAIGYARVARPPDVERLENLNNYVRDYVIGYTSSRELSDLCATTYSRLGDAKEKEAPLSRRDFWQNVQDNLDRARDYTLVLPRLIREDKTIKETIEAFEKHLDEMGESLTARDTNPQGISPIDVANDALRSVGEMKRHAKSMTARCKSKADSLLQEMGHVIRELRSWISIKDEEAGKPIVQLAGVKTGLEGGSREDRRTSQREMGREEPFPSKESRANEGQYRR